MARLGRSHPIQAYRGAAPPGNTFAETLGDTLAFTDESTFDWAGAETRADSLVFTETQSSVQAMVQTSADTLVFTDPASDAQSMVAGAGGDTVVFTDENAQDWAGADTAADTLVFTETESDAVSGTASQGDTLVFTDQSADSTSAGARSVPRYLHGEAVRRAAEVYRRLPKEPYRGQRINPSYYTDSLADGLVFTDSSVADWAGAETLADSLVFTDSNTSDWAGADSLSEALVLSDASGSTRAGVEAASEALSFSDAASAARAGTEAGVEALVFADASAFDWAGGDVAADAVVFTDASATVAAFVQVRADTLVLADQSADVHSGALGFSYANILEHVRAAIQASTGRPTFLAQATGAPSLPYCVVHAFGHSGQTTNSLARDNVETSFYLQLDGVGRTWQDSLWMIDRAARVVRTMSKPPGVADYLVVGRASPTPLGGEGVIGVAQRVNLRCTREPVSA